MSKISCENLKNPPKKYRPLPFWSWNSKLEVDETLFQINEMDENGLGGYFMHARGGLKTEYLGEEWMDNVKAAILDGCARGMAPWGYDENGWPSGFGSGAVCGLGLKYQQKYIHMEITDAPVEDEFTVGNVRTDDGKNRHFFFSVNEYYVDTMDGEVTDEFIKSTHEKYKEALGEDFQKMAGFFTDEPQMSRKPNGIPWSLILPREYKNTYGEDLIGVLHHMFETSEEACRTRFRYWKLVTRLFSENFMKRVYDWCNENGVQLSGHMVLEESFAAQLDCNGSCMPNYLYMHIPGVDKLGRSVCRDLLTPQITSVCAQAGKKQIITESFACCGWDVTFEELKWILEWQMVKGVNLLCQHLEGYSLGGMRKRDFPAGHFFQNPWWKDYKALMDFSARVGMLLAEGEVSCDVLVLHTISSAWMDRCDDHLWKDDVNSKYNDPLVNMITWLDKNQILHHLGDETVMDVLGAKVIGKKLQIGEMEYSTVIIPPCSVIASGTLKLLEEFAAAGGNLIFVGEVPAYVDGEKSDKVKKLVTHHIEGTEGILTFIPESSKYISLKHNDGTLCDVQFARRVYKDYTVYYLVNTFSGKERAVFKTKGKSLAMFDYCTGEIVPFAFETDGENVRAEITLEEKGSIVLFVYNDDRYKPFEDTKTIALSPINEKLFGEWTIVEAEKNAIALDYCDVWFDDEKAATNIPVVDIREMANDFERQVNIKLEFKIKSSFDVPGETYLVLEEAPFFDILINGKAVEKKYCGYFRDKTFIKLDISGLIVKGENTLTLITDFVQSQKVYDSIKDCCKFEGIKNKLWFDREFDVPYILGDFCVASDSDYVPSFNKSYTTNGSFTLVPKINEVYDGNIAVQGYPFFTGKMTLEKKINLTKDEICGRTIQFDRMGAVVTKAEVNGKSLGSMIWAPYVYDLSDLLKEGENVIRIELTSCFRNLLGPLHLGGEVYSVGPRSFYHNSKIYGGGLNVEWEDSYSFLEYGIFLK